MRKIIDIITVTKDDFEGVLSTIKSTKSLRTSNDVRQIIVDSSLKEIQNKIKQSVLNEPNIDYTWQAPRGTATAFNQGLKLSNADWIWFLNGRDEVHHTIEPDKLIYIIKQTSADIVIFQMELMQSGTICGHPPMWAMWPPVNSWVPHPSTIIRYSVFKRYGFFHEKYKTSMDYEIWLRFFSQNITVDTVSIPIALYDETGISSTKISHSAIEANEIIKNNFPMLLKKWAGNAKFIYDTIRHYRKTSRQQ